MPAQPHRHSITDDKQTITERRAACNSTYKKLAVQWLNEVFASYQVQWWQAVIASEIATQYTCNRYAQALNRL
jgi:hypothetical protein